MKENKKVLAEATEIQRVEWYIMPKKWWQYNTYYWARIDSGIRSYGQVIKKPLKRKIT